MTDALTVKIVSGASESLHVRVDLASTSVLSLKHVIEQQDARRFPVAAQRLIFQGQILQDANLLTDYNVTGGCALHLTLLPASTTTPGRLQSSCDQVQTLLQQMRDSESLDKYSTAVQTLQTICRNIVEHPTEDKYRKLRIDNTMLKAKVFDRRGGQEMVKLLGFQDGVQTGHLVLVPTPDKWENLVACKAVVDSMAMALASAGPSAGATPVLGAPGDFPSQAQALLQNPAMLQSIAGNPMVQQMSQQNPMLAQALQNPAFLAQSIQALQQNPTMMHQMSQMMNSPNAMAQMQQLMGGGGRNDLHGGFGATSSNPFVTTSLAVGSTQPPAPIAPIPVTSAAAAAPNVDMAEIYDEDEIAKAIARSLQDS